MDRFINILLGVVIFGTMTYASYHVYIHEREVCWHNNTHSRYIDTRIIDKNLDEISVRVDYEYTAKYKSSLNSYRQVEDYLRWNMNDVIENDIKKYYITKNNYKLSESELLKLKNRIVNENKAVKYSLTTRCKIESPVELSVKVKNVEMYKQCDRML